MPQIVWTSDARGNATYYNRRFLEYTGLREDELDATAWTRVTHPDDLAAVVALRAETLARGTTFEVEYRFRAADGTYRWHLGRAVPIRAADGTIDFWIGTATDIDDRKRIEEAHEVRARAALALETIADGVALVNRDGRVLLWNNAAEHITGIPSAEVVDRPARETLPGAVRSIAALTPDGRPQTIPIEIDGREQWVSVSSVRFDEGTVYAFRDITEQRRLEQMRSDLVATVSHELRTPLAAIHGAALTLRRSDLELGRELSASLLDVIAAESDRLAHIVNDVLLAAHLDSGRLQLKIETVDATRVTETVVDAARTHLPEGITLELAVPPTLPAVAADEQQLRQVLVNLVENAVKYSPDGGPVKVELARAERTVRWTVSDEGLGIPVSERRRVFEKFYRLDPNMTRGIGGTGLGLYICRELVQRLNGRIWVDGNLGRGSQVHVELPAADQRTPAAA
jgi:two-component system phosphate regulon sensor histidine kinase PhoR